MTADEITVKSEPIARADVPVHDLAAVERDADGDRFLPTRRAIFVEPRERREGLLRRAERAPARAASVVAERKHREHRVPDELSTSPPRAATALATASKYVSSVSTTCAGAERSDSAVKSRMSENQIAASMSSPFPR